MCVSNNSPDVLVYHFLNVNKTYCRFHYLPPLPNAYGRKNDCVNNFNIRAPLKVIRYIVGFKLSFQEIAFVMIGNCLNLPQEVRFEVQRTFS